ncbi:hypothetical protein AAV94_06370 [Lampropedia cohaerens]|uniref:ABC transmembrane type-1 domain-containing protein n=2 Tax=Lampropedia cohaerens TaxID=1610491 RepID=A0A0U1Q095_9BURK|nr:hypothetical protein AAV94_06370 [Lampropedia cohaerens]
MPGHLDWARALLGAVKSLWRIGLLLFIALVVFVVLRMLPSDPVAMMLPPGASEQDRIALTQDLGLDKPLLVQFGIWLGNAVQGDLGNAINSGQPVVGLILQALPTTLQLVVLSLLFGALLGVAGGLIAFRFRQTPIERGVQVANSIAISIPEFLWAILLILSLGIGLQWLPFLGPIDANHSVPRQTGFLLIDTLLAGDLSAFGSALKHMAMPVIALSLSIAPPLMRIMHSSLIDAYAEDYVAAARLRGLDENRILVRHALKNAALPTVALLGLQAGTLMGGTVLIETIFGFPGIGGLMLQSLAVADMFMIQGLALTYAVAVQAMNTLSDIALYMLNPRLRLR